MIHGIVYALCVFMVGAVSIDNGQGNRRSLEVSISGSDFNGNSARDGGMTYIMIIHAYVYTTMCE